jgi:(p)ppGpp synthase/HD superfamily hydrolase
MNLLDKAVVFATQRHSGYTRKGTDIPYIVHPLEAVSIAAGLTDDPQVLAAAVLHDVVEDTPTQLTEIESEFGKRVADLVAFQSEDKMRNLPAPESWRVRKEATVNAMQTASADEKILALADKLSNIRAISRDYRREGDKVWDRFNQKEKAMHGWYYRSVAQAVSGLSESDAYQEYCRLIENVFG